MDSNCLVSAVDIIEAEKKRYSAQIACDIEALETLMHPELIYIHSNGHIDSKETYINSINSGRVRYRAMRFDQEMIRIYGSIGILNGIANYDVSVGGIDNSVAIVFHSVWSLDSDGLRFISWQATYAA